MPSPMSDHVPPNPSPVPAPPSPPTPPGRGTTVRGPSSEDRGDSIGPYRLLERLGEGGFGVVWLAERREPFVQRVALKVIKPGMDSRGVIARFDQERQALAVMDHPNVARVLDGGLTSAEQGSRPYFVMEYVKGEPITEYCDRNRLNIGQRLELFIPVCEAVQHAHHKGIIHRDIKPTNVLVTVLEGRLAPKVIDFGVAKAVSHTLTQHTILTEHGQLIGTPEYMSPEQAEMGGTDVDTRTDVYSLGVLLYELLTGQLPFEPATLRAAAFDEVRRIIREEEPPKPSTRLTTLDAPKAADVASRRQQQREELTRTLRRELDWIPLKAMRKDRSRRYATPEAMAEDIQRYLEDRPIEAAPENKTYLFKKFARRYKGPIAAVSAVAVALVLGVVTSSYFWLQARTEAKNASQSLERERAATRTASERAEVIARQIEQRDRITNLMAMFGNAHAEFTAAALSEDDASEYKNWEQLVARLDKGELSDVPTAELSMRTSLAGLILEDIAEYEDESTESGAEAAELLVPALQIADLHFGAAHPTTIHVLHMLREAYVDSATYDEDDDGSAATRAIELYQRELQLLETNATDKELVIRLLYDGIYSLSEANVDSSSDFDAVDSWLDRLVLLAVPIQEHWEGEVRAALEPIQSWADWYQGNAKEYPHDRFESRAAQWRAGLDSLKSSLPAQKPELDSPTR